MHRFWMGIGMLVTAMLWSEFVIDEPGSGRGISTSTSRPVLRGGDGFDIDMLGTVNTFDSLGRGL
ncbi:MAG: hypothetical protein ACK4TN_03375, partial [Brevinematales bacterium]